MLQRTSWQHWQGRDALPAFTYVCGHCGEQVGAHMGFHHTQDHALRIYLCPKCGLPTTTNYTDQVPGAMLGRPVKALPADVEAVYLEIRSSSKEGNETAVVLLARKLIMHIAVEAGAAEGKSFKEYVDYLEAQHYTPPNGKPLVDFIRKLGNEKNHEIKLGEKEEGDKIVAFVQALLYFVYELKAEFDIPSDGSGTP
jgi:DNA-directed RNA polymerase subunit RPC12/RpoP